MPTCEVPAQPPAPASEDASPRLKVSEDHRYLCEEGGRPFFYLGDTAWELFHRLNRAEAALYLDDRAAKGFTVIQAVALAELDGLQTPNAYGHLPLLNDDPTRPDVKPGPRNDYWDHVDEIVAMAAQRGLFVGMLPTWGDKWIKKWGVGPEIFTPENAEKYGAWLGQRYRDQPIIWILGGDRDPDNDVQVEVIRAMARGLKQGDNGRHLITYHPQGSSNSARLFHAEEWLDFNMIQSGHERPVRPNYIDAQKNLNKTPPKPTLDGEPCYEDHPIKGDTWERRHEAGAYLPWFDEWDVRKAAYESVLAGSCGHTYGDHNIWQMWEPGRKAISMARTPWTEALKHPGSLQMKYLRGLFESRPFWRLRADQTLVVRDEASEGNQARAALALDGSFAVLYLPIGSPVTVKLEAITGPQVVAWWWNPRQNSAEKMGTLSKSSQHLFTPPHSGRNNDWILVLDDATKEFAHLGSSYQNN